MEKTVETIYQSVYTVGDCTTTNNLFSIYKFLLQITQLLVHVSSLRKKWHVRIRTHLTKNPHVPVSNLGLELLKHSFKLIEKLLNGCLAAKQAILNIIKIFFYDIPAKYHIHTFIRN